MKKLSDTLQLKKFCIDQGVELVGIADLAPLKKGLVTEPTDLLKPYTAAISIAVTLDMQAVATMCGEPTPEYADNCKDINVRLNKMSNSIEGWIKDCTFLAEAIPASKKLVEGGTEGSVSH
jgi:hypothetical protein